MRQFSSNQGSPPKRADHPSSHTPRGSWSKSFIPKGRPAAYHSIHHTSGPRSLTSLAPKHGQEPSRRGSHLAVPTFRLSALQMTRDP